MIEKNHVFRSLKLKIVFRCGILILLFFLSGCDPKILKDPNGIPVKIITKKAQTPIYKTNEGTEVLENVDWFRFYYLYDEKDSQYFLISKEENQEEATGWIEKGDVELWNNREAICTISIEEPQYNQFFRFYTDYREASLESTKNQYQEAEFFRIQDNYKYRRLPSSVRRSLSPLLYTSFRGRRIFQKKVKEALGKDFQAYWKQINESASRRATTYPCSSRYSREDLPMPVLQERSDIYQVAFLYCSGEKEEGCPIGFDVGWLKIPPSRNYKIKIFIKLSELYTQRDKINQLTRSLLENPEETLSNDRNYMARFLEILKGEAIGEQKDSSLYSLIFSLPKANNPEEIINRNSQEKYVQAQNTLKKMNQLIRQLEESDSKEGWMNLNDTLNF